MNRFRIIGLALLALAVPQIAFGGEEPSAAPATLSVSASLDGCGLAEAAIVCRIDASWSALDGAEHYTVSITRPDGSVVDAGRVAGTSRSLFVPYVGAGAYSVQVAAWGTPPGEDEHQVMARDRAMSTGGDGGAPDVSDVSQADTELEPPDEETEPAADEEDDGGAVMPPDEEAPACDQQGDDPQEGAAEAAEAPEADAEQVAANEEELAVDSDEPPPVCS